MTRLNDIASQYVDDTILIAESEEELHGHGTTDWFQREKEYIKAVYCHPAYLTYMQSTS